MIAVFLDRDGVINEYPGDFKYVNSWEEFHFLPKIEFALKKLIAGGFKLFIISNQAGVGKGEYSQSTLNLITASMLEVLSKHGVKISGVYYCTHCEEDNCRCRKPKPGLIDLAVSEVEAKGEILDLKKSYFVGDSIRDIETGKSKGLKTILVYSGQEKPQNKDEWQHLPDFTALDLVQAAEIILKQT
jgi:histidinol-phosphate phosphatase family protein